MSGDRVERGLGVDVADDHEHGAVGAVVAVVERPEVVDRDPCQVVGPAQDRVAIGVPQVGQGQVGLVEPAEGRIEVAGALLADDMPLRLDLTRVEDRPPHPVGLDRQRELPAVGREGEPVMGRVLAGLGVRMPGGDERQAIDLPLGKPLGPLEEHVLDEVRQPGLTRRLVERADRVVEVGDNDRGMRAGEHQHPEPIGQRPLEDREVSHPGRQGAGGRPSGHGCPLRFAL